jgi:hypothetical protein
VDLLRVSTVHCRLSVVQVLQHVHDCANIFPSTALALLRLGGDEAVIQGDEILLDNPGIFAPVQGEAIEKGIEVGIPVKA